MTQAATGRPISSRDLLRFQMVDDPQVSPDGGQVAWVKSWLDAASNRYRANIQLTDGAGQDTRPRWSPDGRTIAFLATATPPEGDPEVGEATSFRGRLPQLFAVPASGGEARQLTHLAGGASEPRRSPGGGQIAFTHPDRPRAGPRVARPPGDRRSRPLRALQPRRAGGRPDPLEVGRAGAARQPLPPRRPGAVRPRRRRRPATGAADLGPLRVRRPHLVSRRHHPGDRRQPRPRLRVRAQAVHLPARRRGQRPRHPSGSCSGSRICAAATSPGLPTAPPWRCAATTAPCWATTASRSCGSSRRPTAAPSA